MNIEQIYDADEQGLADTEPVVSALTPSPGLLCKLASIAVHADEYHSADGHEFDLVALRSALADPEVKEWLGAMADLAMAPRKRSQS